MTPKCLGLILAFASFLISTTFADATRRSQAARNDEKRENEAVRKAQQELKAAIETERDAQRAAQNAIETLRATERSLTQAVARLQNVRDDLEATHADAAGLIEARRAAEDARKAYEKASQPVLERLAETDEYKAALAAAQAAEEALKRQPGDNASEAVRKERAEWARVAQVPAALKRQALEAEPSLDRLRKRLEGAEESVAAARRIIDRAVENDPALKNARDQIERIKEQLAAARRDAAREERQLIEAQQKTARRRTEVQQKVVADQRDTNRDKPRNKK